MPVPSRQVLPHRLWHSLKVMMLSNVLKQTTILVKQWSIKNLGGSCIKLIAALTWDITFWKVLLTYKLVLFVYLKLCPFFSEVDIVTPLAPPSSWNKESFGINFLLMTTLLGDLPLLKQSWLHNLALLTFTDSLALIRWLIPSLLILLLIILEQLSFQSVDHFERELFLL